MERRTLAANLLKILVLLLALMAASCGRNKNNLGPGTYDLAITVDGRTRTYRLHVPTGYTGDNPFPLVIALHGGGGTGVVMEQLTGFSDLADQENFLAAYPDGAVDNHWADGRGTDQPDVQGVDDVHFISVLIDQIAADAALDENRVYASGFSNGSMMVNRLGRDLSQRLAAIGGSSGQLATNLAGVQPAQPVGVIYFHGTIDPVVPYEGGEVEGPNGGQVIAVSELTAYWVQANKTTATPTIELLPDLDPNDGIRVIHFAFANGTAGTEVHLYRVENGGHTWPGSNQPGATHDVDASRLMWDFFKIQHK